MKRNNNQAGNAVLWVVIIVVGLVVGFAVGRVMCSDKSVTNSATATVAPNSATKAADLRSALVTLGVQHQDLTALAVDSTLDGNKDAAAYTDELIANGNDIGVAVGSVYGKSAETTFDAVWKVHLVDFVKYAGAASTGDEAGKKAALDDISANYTKPLSDYLAKATGLPADTLNSVLSDHVQMTASLIDDHVAGKYADEAAGLKQADQHISGIFSTLAGAIVKQNPGKF